MRTSDPDAAPRDPDLDHLLDALARRVPEQADAVADLAVAAYRRASTSGLRELHDDVETAVSRLLSAFAFLDGRPPGELAVRAYNPVREEHGWEAAGSIVEVNVEDSPFLVSTVTEELGGLGYEPDHLMHPVVGVVRGEDGRITAIRPARSSATRESFIHIQLDRRLPETALGRLHERLVTVLADATAATRDFPKMREKAAEVTAQMERDASSRYEAEEIQEAAELLRWLLDDHFVMLGYREYALCEVDGERAAGVVEGSGLGILAEEKTSSYAEPVPLSDIPEDLRGRMVGGDLLLVSRTNRRSTVHRQARMIYVGIKRVGEDGEIDGEHRFLGLFAQKAYAEPASTIPLLRRKLKQILDAEDVVDHSYDERALRALFDAFPKHELFAAQTEELRQTLVPLLETQKQEDVGLLCRVDPGRRGVSALVSVPRERFNANLRKRVQDLLADRFESDTVDYHLSMTDGGQALLHFLLHADAERVEEVAFDQLERDVVAITRTWEDEVRDALVAAHGQSDGTVLAQRWAGRFPTSYQATVKSTTAVADIAELGALVDSGQEVRIRLQPSDDPTSDGPLRVKLYKAGRGVELSAFMPILESLGFVVVEELPHVVDAMGTQEDSRRVHIHDFAVRIEEGLASGLPQGLDVDTDGRRVAAAARAIWDGRAQADSLNRLVLAAGLHWHDIVILRAYRRYRRQVGTAFTEAYQNAALLAHPAVARALMDLFHARLDPDREDDADGLERARAAVLEGLDAVQQLDHDRILRRYHGVIEATLRTNRYIERGHTRGSSALALKIDSARVPEVPKPIPHVEIFVYSTELEGVHLRGGRVARGGLRWSDRQEDVRTEVLGLMKAQMVKNSVIVPAGSKGGFVLKHPSSDPQQLRSQVREQYETYIRALLDVTDNVVDGEVVPPSWVRRQDGDDPYLVVAADRGTATFSDVANAISEEYGFWLGDAFASGGSRGYDHKAMGITARGAWVAVERHFRELGVDIQTERTRVVGIGDMSGDVFGNGLLRSEAVQLVAAFDHRDIIIDPDPDPAASFAERRRLYETPGSTWQDYDRAVLSEGGGIWSRSVKEIALSAEARAVLRIEQEHISPPELVRAILRAPVDLLFAGGIGTFVKASDESHADVGDRVNDAIRVDASELGARVVGEGGNLAMTQAGRIQYARRGGRCNTDAIDNSAGVDTSDREVNLKILFGIASERGLVTGAERDDLLRAMTDDVAAQVLRDVYLQTWAISGEMASSVVGMEAYEQLMVDLESPRAGPAGSDGARLDRQVELLPSSEEMRERRDVGAGMVRPELAVLLGYAKVDLRTRLLNSALPDDPALRATLVDYFPPLAVERFSELFDSHRLRRELVATTVANEIINRMGITYVSRTAHEFGCMAFEVAAAYWAARTICDAPRHWADVEDLDSRCDPQLQLELKSEVDRLVDAFVRAYLRQGGSQITERIERDKPALDELQEVAADLGSPAKRADRRRRSDRYVDLGIPEGLADRLTALSDLIIVPDVSVLTRQTGQPVRHVAEVFFRINEALPMDYLLERLRQIEPQGQWERWQHRGLLDELRWARRTAASRILSERPGADAEVAVAEFLGSRVSAQERVHGMVELLEREDSPQMSAIAVAIRVLRDALSSEPVGR